jgi:hypothetical protein
LHAISISGMATSALLGIASMLAFITIRWPTDTGRFVIALLIFSIVGFLASASIAVFSAAKDTYATSPRSDPEDDSDA